ncbi:MAG TPA: B12-binding domain-containing protein, partial [Jatrophihabitans sp.]|nr:B12-binding domain-containing protein [Jatrophihabitans sp.]
MAPVIAIAADGVEEFAEAVTALDPVAGRDVVSRLLADGADPISVIDQVVVPSQRQVGLRWQRAEWTVAQQHAATEVALAAADVLRRHLASLPRRRGHVLLACAEREWHGLPAILVALAVRAAGWETTVLGTGVSPLRLSRYLHELGPDATAFSCSVLGAL